MAKQTFTTGQVLTASQMTSLQQTAMGGGSATAKTASYVLVAADAGGTVAMNAAGATTITVNTALFAAGDTVFIQNLGAGACTVTAGTATVASAGSLILPQYDAGILYFTATGASIFYDYIQAGAVSPLTTKGDLYGFSTLDARIPIGTNNQVLTADSAQALGLKWATPAGGGGLSLLSTTTLTGSVSSTISIASGYTNLLILVRNVDGSADMDVTLRLNGDSGNNYAYTTLFVSGTVYAQSGTGVNNPTIMPAGGTAGYQYNGFASLNIYRYTETENKIINFIGRGTTSAQATTVGTISWNNTAAITSIAFTTNGAATFDAGEVYVYGVN